METKPTTSPLIPWNAVVNDDVVGCA